MWTTLNTDGFSVFFSRLSVRRIWIFCPIWLGLVEYYRFTLFSAENQITSLLYWRFQFNFFFSFCWIINPFDTSSTPFRQSVVHFLFHAVFTHSTIAVDFFPFFLWFIRFSCFFFLSSMSQWIAFSFEILFEMAFRCTFLIDHHHHHGGEYCRHRWGHGCLQLQLWNILTIPLSNTIIVCVCVRVYVDFSELTKQYTIPIPYDTNNHSK